MSINDWSYPPVPKDRLMMLAPLFTARPMAATTSEVLAVPSGRKTRIGKILARGATCKMMPATAVP